MKRMYFLLLVAVALVACEKERELAVNSTDLQEVVTHNKVSLKQALLYAENSINGIKPTTRGAERKVKSTEIYVAKPATRSAEGAEVSFYLINYEDNQGFAMVSTDSRATPVYAYSDEGSLTAEDFETNPFLKIFIEGSVENYQIEVANNSIYDPIEWPDSSNRDVLKYPIVEYKGGRYYRGDVTENITKPNLLTTYWHQNTPYGINCPGGVAGCAPIAAAQIMAYHKHPAQFGTTVYNWNAMTADSDLQEGTIGAIAAAELIHQIGDTAGVEYEDGITGTTIYHIRNTIWFFSYNCSEPSTYDVVRVRGNIDAEKPVLMGGYNSVVGHAWVIDGYNYHNSSVTYYYTFAPYNVFESIVLSNYTYFHCNLGWGENDNSSFNNGYFNANSFLHNNNLTAVYDITPR